MQNHQRNFETRRSYENDKPKSYPCLILKLSLIDNSTDASPVGDPDFHNWGKLAANTRPQTILTMEAT